MIRTKITSKPFIAFKNEGLQAEKISKFYSKKRVLNDVSLKLKKGESVAILGPNGAGKTTFFYILMGLIKPDIGKVVLNQEEITNLPMYRRAQKGLGYLPQESSIFRGLHFVGSKIGNICDMVFLSFGSKPINKANFS